jgi:hypothetical protein
MPFSVHIEASAATVRLNFQFRESAESANDTSFLVDVDRIANQNVFGHRQVRVFFEIFDRQLDTYRYQLVPSELSTSFNLVPVPSHFCTLTSL